MKTVLVPVDFSETSVNAATYAVKMFTGVYGVTLVLFHVYEKPEHANSSKRELSDLKDRLFEIGIVKMEKVMLEGLDFIDTTETWLKKNPVDMIIMGITGRGKIGQALIGSNTLTLIKKNYCPLMIVPANAKFNQLKNIALASDFTKTLANQAVDLTKELLSAHYGKLHIVNVNPEHHATASASENEVKKRINESFKGYEHEFYFIGLYDFPETMALFVHDHHIDLMITLPKDHGWLGSLFGASNTKKLAYQGTIPVLAMNR